MNTRVLLHALPIWWVSLSSSSETRFQLPPGRQLRPPPPKRFRQHSRWHCGPCRGLITLDRGSLHKALATASGAAGGAFGLATLPVELPVSTIIMLRSIAEIARSEGEDPSDPESALSCIQVFALGGRAGSTDASESGYFAVRGMLAKSVTEAARFIAERGIIEEGAPVLVRFISLVASRFGVVLTQKFAAQALPVVGALGGASVNYVFIEHFQEIAQGHFTVRRLERAYGKDIVRAEYERLAQNR